MPQNYSNNKKYILALGGTFDHFHKGHRYFLTKAFNISEKITIGISSDKLAKTIHKDAQIQSFKVRKKKVFSYVKKNTQIDTEIVQLNDIFGPTLKDKPCNALLVTENTITGANLINKKRQKFNKTQLKIISCPLLKAEDGKYISSSRIRKGEIDRKGTHFFSKLLEHTPITISKTCRRTLRKPFGKVFNGSSRKLDKAVNHTLKYIEGKRLYPIISVGDDVTSSLLSLKITPQLSIVDLHVKRKRKYQNVLEHNWPAGIIHSQVKNPSAMITKELVKSVKINLEKETPTAIEVIGEEDLSVIPCVLLAPLNSVVLYGHFQYGIVLVEVTERKKKEALTLLSLLHTRITN